MHAFFGDGKHTIAWAALGGQQQFAGDESRLDADALLHLKGQITDAVHRFVGEDGDAVGVLPRIDFGDSGVEMCQNVFALGFIDAFELFLGLVGKVFEANRGLLLIFGRSGVKRAAKA